MPCWLIRTISEFKILWSCMGRGLSSCSNMGNSDLDKVWISLSFSALCSEHCVPARGESPLTVLGGDLFRTWNGKSSCTSSELSEPRKHFRLGDKQLSYVCFIVRMAESHSQGSVSLPHTKKLSVYRESLKTQKPRLRLESSIWWRVTKDP